MERIGDIVEREGWPSSFDELLERYRSMTPAQRDAAEARASERAFLESRAAQRARAVEIAQSLSDIGERFAERTFATFDVQARNIEKGGPEALAAAREVADEPARRGLWLFSPPGLGKSHLAAAIVNEVTSRGVPAAFTTALRLLDRLRDTYTDRGHVRAGELDVIQRLIDVPVLVVDDIDKARFTGWASERMYAVVNGRYEKMRRIIVTSNLTPATLVLRWREQGIDEVIGDAIADRLRPMCGTFRELAGMSYRRAGVE